MLERIQADLDTRLEAGRCGILDHAQAMAHLYGLDWPAIVGECKESLGAGARELLDQAQERDHRGIKDGPRQIDESGAGLGDPNLGGIRGHSLVYHERGHYAT